MAYDDGLADLMRTALAEFSGVTEQKMFGGLAFMLNGHMVCGVHKGGGMFRVGKDREEAALTIPGVGLMGFPNGRRMPGMVDASDATVRDDIIRGKLIDLSLDHVRSLPAK